MKLKAILATILLAVSLVGCATIKSVGSNDLIVQFSTMKLIERPNEIESQDVLDAIERARKVINVSDVEVSLDDLKARVAEEINFDELAPSDRLLITAVVAEVEENYTKTYDVEIVSDELKVTIGEFLDAVEMAARMY